MRKREEIPEKYKWDLAVFYKDEKDFEKDIKKLESLKRKIIKLKGKITENADNFITALQTLDDIERVGENLATYVAMSLDLDTRIGKNQEIKSKIDSLIANIQSEISFVTPEMMKCPKSVRETLLKDKKYLFYKHAIKRIFDQAKHILSEQEERIIASYSEISEAPYKTFSMLNNADLQFDKAKDSNGKEHDVSNGNFSLYMISEDRTLRENVYNSLYKEYRKHINTLSSTLETTIKANITESHLRKYKSALEASLSPNKIPTSVYDNLLESIENKMEYHKEYMRMKKDLLGFDNFHFYDVYLPLVKDVKYKKEYDEAKEIVLEALSVIGKDYVKIARGGLNNRWVDVYETPGKRSGAYSWGTYDTPPLMLLNYQGTLDSVFTLAHELGHSMHSYYSKTIQKHLYSQYPIFLAEIASTVNEVLLSLYLLENIKDKNLKLYVLNHFLEGFKSTVYRQAMFAEFEKNVYETVEKGNGLSAEKLTSLYENILEKYFGNTIIIDDKIKHEWSRIPHFYYNFYVYQYATGFTTAVYIAKKIYERDEKFTKGYIKFLSSGGSDYPIRILKKTMKIDLTTPNIVNEALDYFKSMLDSFKKLTEKDEDIKLIETKGKKMGLSDFEGKWIVLYFYPKDNTSGCTTEAKEFTELKEDFKKLNCEIIGVSPDTCEKHKKFVEKNALDIKLLCDPEHKLIKKFGVWQKKKNHGKEYMGLIRSTFIIDPKGNIIKKWKNVRAKGHAKKVLEALKEAQKE